MPRVQHRSRLPTVFANAIGQVASFGEELGEENVTTVKAKISPVRFAEVPDECKLCGVEFTHARAAGLASRTLG